MTFTNTQTKLGQAITTNASGDYAVRTIIEGDQTLENLTLTGDLNGGGGHILNDQTTTNMMSKGTFYRLDGGTNHVAISHIFGDGDFSIFAKMNADLSTDFNRIIGGPANALEFYIAGGYLQISKRGVALPSASTTLLTTLTDYSVGYVRSGSTGTYYVNGIAAGTTSDALDYSAASSAIGIQLPTTRPFLGEMGEVLFTNFAPTAAEVKDLISGNIPFKWQYGSQTELVTNGNAEAFTGGLADGWYSITHTYAEEATIVHTAGGKSQKITAADGTTLYGGLQNTSVAMEIGKTYRWSAWAYSATATRSMTCELRNNANAVRATQTQDVGAGWTQFTGVITVADAMTAPDFWVKVTPTTSDVYYFDDLSIVAIGAVALYDQTSISETYWGDVANNNDGAVTGATVLNQPDGMAFKNIILSPVAQDATPKEGQLIYNSATNKLNVWTGAAWEVVTSA